MRIQNYLLIAGLIISATTLWAQPDADMPTDPGKCFAKCFIPDQYQTLAEQIQIKPATKKTLATTAKYEFVTENVLTRQAGEKLIVTPARFEKASEQVKSSDASRKLSFIPASFSPQNEQVLSFIDAPGVKIIPATFENKTEQVLIQEAYTELRVIPAKFETVTEQVLKHPAHNVLKMIPAEYENVKERVLVKESYSTSSLAPAITDLEGLRQMIKDDKNSYTTKSGLIRTFSPAEIAAIKSLDGINTSLVSDNNGNVYAIMTEQVLEKDGYSTISIQEDKYEKATEQVLAKEASSRIDVVPAGYQTVTETIEVSPASSKWVKQKTESVCLSSDPEDCLVWCFVEVPAEYKTITKLIKRECPTGYTASGEDCIKTIVIPAEYTTRTFNKLASKASSSRNSISPKYGTRTWQKMIVPAGVTKKEVPAQYEERTYTKITKPATTITVAIPAIYETRAIQKLVSPATTEEVEVPAKYGTRTFKSLLSKASTVEVACGKKTILKNINFRTNSAELLASSQEEIKKLESILRSKSSITARLVGHTDSDGSEEYNESLSKARAKSVYDALVKSGIDPSSLSYDGKGETEPLVSNDTDEGKLTNRRTEFITFGDDDGGGDCTMYEIRTFQKLATDASSTSTDIPASYVTRSYEKLTTDASVASSEVPTEYGDRRYQKLLSNASVSTTDLDAQFITINKRILTKEGGFSEWKEVVCDADITEDLVRKVQKALMDRGYNLSSYGADNQFGQETKAAIIKFQTENNLPIGQLDLETLKALGITKVK